MINLLITQLSRLLSQSCAHEPQPAKPHDDSSWHSSSFDLAQGLVVIELPGTAHAVFVDTLPAFQPPRA